MNFSHSSTPYSRIPNEDKRNILLSFDQSNINPDELLERTESIKSNTLKRIKCKLDYDGK
jgi:hypothetical protein